MYAERNSGIGSSTASGAESMDSSFSSCSSVWDGSTYTPDSSRRQSFDSIMTPEGTSYAASTTGANMQDGYRFHGGFSISAMPHDLIRNFNDPSMMYEMDSTKLMADQNMMEYTSMANFGTNFYQSFDGLSGNHSCMGELLSPTSEIISSTKDFVDPAQTTFMSPCDAQSPMDGLQLDTSPATSFATASSTTTSPTDSQYFELSCDRFRSQSITPSRPTHYRVPLMEPLPTSAALHRVQQGNHALADYQQQMQKLSQLKRRAKREVMLSDNIRFQNKASKACPWDGCDKKFQRQEHLKRHEKTHIGSPMLPCQFCQKKFGRSDNLKSHIKLHFAPRDKKSSRTNYNPAAEAVYREMNSKKSRRSGDSSLRVKQESEASEKSLTLRPRI